MAKSYRIRTEVGVDKNINVQLDQEFEYLEILSLKILQEQIYTRPCSDYGVVVGRIVVNGGYGLPNAKVSIFIPISDADKLNPIISELYPYEKVTDQNIDGYRYNLLPYIKSYSNHNPTGTFFTREDVLTNPTLIEIYDKYYKYCATTNAAGDFMIFGVPTGNQKIHCDIDLSDIGEFSLSPQDLIRMGLATPSQVAGTSFNASSNLNELPQIVTINSDVDVTPLWGQTEICNLGITRVDFDLTKDSQIKIEPTAIFMGSIMTTSEEDHQKVSCKPTLKQGSLCSLSSGPGIIETIRQTLFRDNTGRPVLEKFDLEQGGQVIDENGAFVVDVPMNLDYVITNEFGEQVISPDPKVGIPTKGKYRFKVKWIQSADLQEPIKRGYFLIPNVREYGWDNGIDPFTYLLDPNLNEDFQKAEKSYAFSLNWDDYVAPNVAIACEDFFYQMTYNKVYTVSQFLDSYSRGTLLNRKIAIKDVLNPACESEVNRFPVNDGQFQFDIVYILFTILLFIIFIILNIFLVVWHIVGYVVKIVGAFIGWVLDNVAYVLRKFCNFVNQNIINPLKNLNISGWYPFSWLSPVTFCDNAADRLEAWAQAFRDMYKYFENVQIPNLTYPDCVLCDCKTGEKIDEPIENDPGVSLASLVASQLNSRSFLCPVTAPEIFNRTDPQTPNLPGSTIPSGTTGTIQTPPDMFYRNYDVQVGYQLSGFNLLPDEEGSSKQRVPNLTSFGNFHDYVTVPGQDLVRQRSIFTTSLPISEKMNLFNLKSKYFDETPGSYAGVGVNRIKVTFDTDLNNPLNKYHYDNTLTLLLNNDQLKKMKPGQLMSFQNPALSFDPNLTGVTELNQYGGTSVTGKTINTGSGPNPSIVTISYANPDGSGELFTYYNTVQEEGDMYQKFASDIEYFMVITAMTVEEYYKIANPYSKESTLNKRYLGSQSIMQVLKSPYGSYDWEGSSAFTVNSLSAIKDGKKQGVVFLVRGVDPHSTRTKNRYDLSYLFGYTEDPWGTHPECIVQSDAKTKYFWNQPIKGGILSLDHENILTNLQIDSYSGYRLYYDSFRFQPSNTGYASFSSFTTNLHTYYSSFNLNFIGTGPGTFGPGDGLAPPIAQATFVDAENHLTLYPNVQTNLFAKEFPPQYNGLPNSGITAPDCYITNNTTNKLNITSMTNNTIYSLYQDETIIYDNAITPSWGNISWCTSGINEELDELGNPTGNYTSYSFASYTGNSLGQNAIRATIYNSKTNTKRESLVKTFSAPYPASSTILYKILCATNVDAMGNNYLLTIQPGYNGPNAPDRRPVQLWVFNQNLDSLTGGAGLSTEGYIVNQYITPNSVLFTNQYNNQLGEPIWDIAASGNGDLVSFYPRPYGTPNWPNQPAPVNAPIPVGYPVLQRNNPTNSLKNWPLNNSPFIQVDNFLVSKTQVRYCNETGLIFCGYLASGGTNSIYVKIYDPAFLAASMGPTGQTSDYVIAPFGGIVDFSIDVSPTKRKLIVSWVQNDGKVKFRTYNYGFENYSLVITKIQNVGIEIGPFPTQIQVTSPPTYVQVGSPQQVEVKFHKRSGFFTFVIQTNDGYKFYQQYFTELYTNPNTNSPQLMTFQQNGVGTPTPQLGKGPFTLSTLSQNQTFLVNYKNTSTDGLAVRYFQTYRFYPKLSKGYYQYEFLEGGGIMTMKTNATLTCAPGTQYWNYEGFYYSPTYSKDALLTIQLPQPGTYLQTNNPSYAGPGGGPQNNDNLNPPILVTTYPPPKLVMRSDRLPTSTYEDKSFNNSYPLHTNQFFTCFVLDDNGRAFVLGGKPVTPPNVSVAGDEENNNAVSNLLSTTTCSKLVPLNCYTSTNNSISVKPSSDACYYNGVGNTDTDKVMRNGCYTTVTKIWNTLINGRDLQLLVEWKARIDINFAACRNVFGHYFRNNWINGTLFAFSIQNDRKFSPVTTFKNGSFQTVSPTNPFVTTTAYITKPNYPYSSYCYRTVHLHSKTNEFFYRSSPFIGGGDYEGSTYLDPKPLGSFVGRDNPNNNTSIGFETRNEKFLMFPTTIMDLGPRANYIQEIVMSDEFDGYVAGKLPATTFNDMTPPLNLFILSRLVALNPVLFFKGVFYYFNRGLYIDGDYAQIIATQSQAGIVPYNESTYNNVSGQTYQPIFFSSGEGGFPLLGIFYDSDLDIKDALTPRRTIINGDVPQSFCSFNNLNTFTQKVPSYQWRLSPDPTENDKDLSGANFIFGTALNGWYTKPILEDDETGETFFQFTYQKLDRTSILSRYFSSKNVSQTKNYKGGYIYSVGQDGNSIKINPSISTWQNTSSPLQDTPQRLITMGTPFYFYFGLKKGKTSMDLFKRKWVPQTNITI